MTQTEQLRSATAEIIEIPVEQLGISVPHLVRPIVDEDVDVLAETDETEWDVVEIRLWPEEYEPPATEHIRYHVISGNHRTRAARKKGLATLRCRILEAPDEVSYKLFAIKSNTRHGKNFTSEQRVQLARELQELGKSLAEIATVFGVHKSTVSNWLSGRDSNASKKREAEPLRNATPELIMSNGHSALLSMITAAPLNMRSEDARAALALLPAELQEKARKLQAWLDEVLR
jgi:ParB-like chromosome segregation protein Spo0J